MTERQHEVSLSTTEIALILVALDRYLFARRSHPHPLGKALVERLEGIVINDLPEDDDPAPA